MSLEGETKSDTVGTPKDDGVSDTTDRLPETTAPAGTTPSPQENSSATAEPISTVHVPEQSKRTDALQADGKTPAVQKSSTEEETSAANESANDEKNQPAAADGDPPADKEGDSSEKKTESMPKKIDIPLSLKPIKGPAPDAENHTKTEVSSTDKKNTPPDDAMDIDDPLKDGDVKVTKTEDRKSGAPGTTKQSTEVEQATSDSVTRTGDEEAKSSARPPAISSEKSHVITTSAAMETDPVSDSKKASGPSVMMDKKAEPKLEPATMETDEDAFENFVRSKRPLKKKRKVKAIKVNLTTPVPTRDTASKSSEMLSLSSLSSSQSQIQQKTYTTAERMLAPDEEFWGPSLLNDALSFFEETHEEQDPAFEDYVVRKKKDDFKKKLDELAIRDREGREEIESLINRLSKEKRESTDKSHQIYREKVDHDERKEMAALRTTFQERNQMEQKKIQKGLTFLQAKQQKEVNMALQHHSQRRLPEQVAQVEWQKTTMALQGKHNGQLQEFRKKTEGMTQATNDDFSMQRVKLEKKYGKKRAEVDARRDKFVSQQMGQFSQLKQRYLKRHLQKIITERSEISQEMSDGNSVAGPKSPEKSLLEAQEAMAEKEEHRPPSPVKFVPDWAKDLGREKGESIIRQKHRKVVLSQAVRQLSIEVHNEGIWSLVVRKIEEDGKTETVDEEFMEWGPRAFMTMESVVCGEIPSFYEKLNFSDAPAAQGGQLRCSIIDLRTSSETAAVHRCEAFKEQQASSFTELEKTTNDLVIVASDAEKAFKKSELEEQHAASDVEKAASFHDKAKRDLEAFRAKFHSFLGPGKFFVDLEFRLRFLYDTSTHSGNHVRW